MLDSCCAEDAADECAQVLQVPTVRKAITEAQAADIVGGTPQQFDAFIKSELKRWPEVVRAAGIKAD